jgi:hypothetical protein
MSVNFKTLVEDFQKVAGLAGIKLEIEAIRIEQLTAPHEPPKSMPAGCYAVYIFLLEDQCLKVGKAGPKSSARYCSQHYNYASSNSNLSNSLFKSREKFSLQDLPESEIGSWIKNKTKRVNLIIDAKYGAPVLTLLEAFVQCRLSPYFEGFLSQRAQ